MCLGIPGKVLDIDTEAALRTGRVAFGGVVRDVCLAYVPEAEVGDYVVVHVGVAISRMDAAEAARTFELLGQLGDLDALGEEPA